MTRKVRGIAVVALATGMVAVVSGCSGGNGGGPLAGGGGHPVGGQAGGAPVNGQGGMGGAIAIRVIDPGLAGMMGGTAGGGGASVPVTGVLEIVAGQLGGEGNIDGVGTNARFRVISDMVFDPDDNRVFVRDYDSGDTLRAIDGDTGRVTTLGTLPDGELVYQRGSLYVAHPAGTQLTEISPTDGHVLATIVEQTGPQVSPGHPLLAWPDGDAMFQVSDDGRLWRVETATGNVSVTPLTGFPSSAIGVSAPVMAGPTTILASVLTWYDSRPQLNEVLSIDVLTGTAAVVGTIPPENTVFGIDPHGQFVVLDTGTVPLGASNVMPSFPVVGQPVTGPRGTILMSSGTGIQIWDRIAAASASWVGLDLASPLAIKGPGDALIFHDAPLAIAAAGGQAYVTWALPADGLAVIDLTTKAVSVLSQAKALNAAAVLPLADGTLYVTERADCSVWQLGAAPDATPTPLSPAMGTCLTIGSNDTTRTNWVTSGLALFDGSLLMVSSGVDGIVQIDPVQGTWRSRGFYDRAGAGEPDRLQLSGAAVGSDGLLYVVDGKDLYRIDHGLHTATVVGQGGDSVAADGQGHLFTTDADSVLRYDIATGQMLRVVGVPGSAGVSLGALPGSLNHPRGLAVTAAGDLLMGNRAEYVVLRARFQ